MLNSIDSPATLTVYIVLIKGVKMYMMIIYSLKVLFYHFLSLLSFKHLYTIILYYIVQARECPPEAPFVRLGSK